MGVVYKFNDEVVDLILRQKKENPALSCRRLVDIVQKEFRIVTSKSAINNILKASGLSSSVGRRSFSPATARPAKSAVPAKRKKVIPVGQTLRRPKSPPRPGVFPEEKSISPATRTRKEIIIDGAGSIFLKAMEWNMASAPPFAGLLREYVDGFSAEDIAAATEVLLSLPFFGINRPEELASYSGQGLWVINGLSTQFDYNTVLKTLQQIKDPAGLSLKMSNEIPQLYSQVNGFQFILEDKSEVWLDAQHRTAFAKNVHSENPWPADKALSNLSKQIIHNLAPLIVQRIPGETSFAPEFFDWMAAFENLPGKKITAAVVYNEEGQELTRFTALPEKRRFFITAAWPWQREFEILSQAAATASRGTVVLASGEKYTVQEVSGHGLKALSPKLSTALRIFLVAPADTPQLAMTAVVTNIPDEMMRPAQIAARYLERWPNPPRSPADAQFSTPQKDFPPKTSDEDFEKNAQGRWPEPASPVLSEPWPHMEMFSQHLHQYSQKYFFPSSCAGLDLDTMRERVYSLSGVWRETPQRIEVCFRVPGNYPYRQELTFAARRFNESDIRDFSGKKCAVGNFIPLP